MLMALAFQETQLNHSKRSSAGEMGLDQNVWFNNVELAAAKKIGREAVQYVSNIYKYYIAYRLVEEHKQEKLKNKL